MEERTIKLTQPIPVPTEGGGVVNVLEIKLGRVKAKHLKLLPKSFFDGKGKDVAPTTLYEFLAGLSGLPLSSIEEIDVDDLTTVIDELVSLLPGASPKTGERSSGE